MSTSPSHARISPNWKEEVNQRLAAHKNRKPVPVTEQDTAAPEQHASNNRAAAAAARVAARFAKAPRYSELLENEARAAVRAAEAVSRAALQAQAAAESVLAELEAAKAIEPEWQFDRAEEAVTAPYRRPALEEMPVELAEPSQPEYEAAQRNDWVVQSGRDQSYDIHWEPDVPRLHPETDAASSHTATEEWRRAAYFAEESVEVIEPVQPIHANLIEFPREIVAPRKARPRRAEGPFAAQHEQEMQLSIFEVEPEAISTDPVSADSMNPESAPTWMSAEWSGMELDEHPAYTPNIEVHQQYVEEPVAYVLKAKEIYLAPM